MADKQQFQVVDVQQFDGLNTLDDPTVLSPSESPYMVNMDITSNGSIQTRFGYEKVLDISGTGGMKGALPYYRTYDDNNAVDQSQDYPTHGYGSTYTIPTSISEAATDKCTFTPTKTNPMNTIGVYVIAKGVGDLTLTLHDASNNVLCTNTIINTGLTNLAWNYFSVPYTWTSGALHFHITSTDAGATLKCNTLNDLSTASYVETYSTKGDYLLLFYNGNTYYWQNGQTSATSIGSYGTPTTQVRGVVHNNVACFGDGYSLNTPKYWDATTLSVLSYITHGNIFGIYNNRLFMSGNPTNKSSVYYSDNSTTNTNLNTNFLAVSAGDGSDVTALVNNNDSLYVFKDDTIQPVNFSFDASYNETLPKVQPKIMNNGGCAAPGSIQSVYGYMYFLSRSGFQNFGNLEQGVTASLPLPISFKIEPTVSSINLYGADNVTSEFFQGKYICAAPFGNSTVANGCLVWNEIVKRRFGKDNWVYYNGIPAAQFAVFRDANKRDQLYFASALEPVVYKFNNTFSDNGSGYLRLWRSKTFRFGERTRWHYIDIEGAKTLNSTVYVDMWLDGVNYNSVEITDRNFITGAGGGYIGENVVGDTYTGGGYTATSNSPLYKFKKRVRVPYPTNEGYQFYFQIRNNADGEGWKLTRYRLKYEYLPDDPSYSYTD